MNSPHSNRTDSSWGNRVATALIIIVLSLMIILLVMIIRQLYPEFPDINLQRPTPTVPAILYEPIKIGIAVVKTDTIQNSSFSTIGKEQENGVKTAQFHYRGLVIGNRSIEFVVKDTKDISTTADIVYKELIADPLMGVIIGPSVSSLAATTHSLANDAGIVAIGPSTTAFGIPRGEDFIYRVSAGAEKMAEVSVNQAFSRSGIKKVVIAYAISNTFTIDEAGAFNDLVNKRLAGVEGSSVISFTYNKDDANFPTIATQLAQSITNEIPDVVIISGFAKDGGTLVKSLNTESFTGTIIGGNGLNTPALFQYCTPNCNGLLIAQAYDWTYHDAVNDQFKQDFYEAMKGTTDAGKEPGQFVAQLYTGIEVVIAALENLDKRRPLSGFSTTDPKDLRNELRIEIQKLNDLATPLGPISFNDIGDIKQDRFAIAVVDGTPGEEKFVITK